MQNAIVEHKVGIIILVVNDNTLLSRLKAETLAKFKNELLQMTDESFLQVMLVNYILCLKSKKLECERLTYRNSAESWPCTEGSDNSLSGLALIPALTYRFVLI